MLIIAYCLLIVCIGVVLFSKAYVPGVVLVSILFFHMGFRLNIGTIDFPASRIIVVVSLCRIIFRGEYKHFNVNTLDKSVFAWGITALIMYVILYKTQSAFIYKTGRSIDILGSYFVFRTQIRSVEDIKRFIDILTISTLIYGIFIIIEDLTYTNIITKYSGVYIPKLVRDGQIRCHGSFTNSILSGTFATAALPLLVANYSFNKDKWYIYAGLIAILPIVFLSASGAAKLSFAAAIVFLAMWKIKQHVKTIQKGFLFFVLISALIMKAPVWFLIAKASSIVGGGGYHRAFLIDQAFKYFSEWWLCGTTYTAHWFPYVLAISPNHCDLTNQFIFEGVNGGLLTMILFIFLIIQAYQRISGGLRLGNYEFLFWCFGVSLSVHIVTVFSISYFDQSAMYFFLLLGIIGTDTFSNNFELTKTT